MPRATTMAPTANDLLPKRRRSQSNAHGQGPQPLRLRTTMPERNDAREATAIGAAASILTNTPTSGAQMHMYPGTQTGVHMTPAITATLADAASTLENAASKAVEVASTLKDLAATGTSSKLQRLWEWGDRKEFDVKDERLLRALHKEMTTRIRTLFGPD